jgi:hypothetical protein
MRRRACAQVLARLANYSALRQVGLRHLTPRIGELMALQTLKATASKETILATLIRDGACIIADVADAATVRRMTDEVTPFIERTPRR